MIFLLKIKRLNMNKLILALSVFWGSAFSVLSQDTIVDKKGNLRTGKILFYDQTYNLISFSSGTDTIYLDMAEVTEPTFNQERIGKVPFYITKSPATKAYVHKMGIAKQQPNFTYSPYSFGINLFSLIRPVGMLDRDIDRFFATNHNIDIFFQKEIRTDLALRFPMRIGISPLNEVIIKDIGNYGEYSKEIIGDLGIEPLFYLNGLTKATWFVAPSLCLGLVRKVTQNYDYNFNAATYTPSGNAGYFKIGSTFGFQLNLTPGIQFGLEYGAHLSNNAWHYYYESTPTRRTYFGYTGKFQVSYRLGGKPRNKE
jgi:hypothetical protein